MKGPTIVSNGTMVLESEVASSDAGLPPKMTSNEKRPTMMSVGSWNPLHRVDALSTLRELYLELNNDIKTIQTRILSDTPTGSSAFVTFNTQAGAQVATQTLTTNTPSKLQERFCNVASNDVMWNSMEMGVEERMIRSLVGTAAAVALNIFWCIIGKLNLI
jgi:hypothetical protein